MKSGDSASKSCRDWSSNHSKGVTMHGMALNVNIDLPPFDLITPCGIEGCQVTSMENLLDQKVDIQKVRERLAYHFSEVFEIEWKESDTRLSA